MTWPTHILTGLIIGKITGNYPAALAGSVLIDLDHTISYFRHGVLFKPRKLLKKISEEKDPWGDQRGFLHNTFGWVIISILFLLINFKFGLVFSVAYFFHLVLDALDTANFYPFFPYKKFMIKGFIEYWSKQEIIFSVLLLAVFIII